MWNTNIRAVFLVFLFAGILSLAYSLPTSTVIINSTGEISSSYSVTLTTAQMSTGAASAIQSAINNVISHGGGTVYVPAGDWHVDQEPTASYGYGGAIPIDLQNLPSGAWLNIIGLYTNTTVTTQNGQTLYNVPNVILRSTTHGGATFGVVGSNETGTANYNFVNSANRHIRISGITILGDVINDTGGGTGISLEFVDGYLVDHCAIDSNTNADIFSDYSKGVVSNCILTQLYHSVIGGVWGYGVEVCGNFGFYSNGLGTPTWIQNVSQVVGQYNWQGITLNYTCPVKGNLAVQGTTSSISYTAGPVYVESNIFYECRHTVSSSLYGYYVERYNVEYGGVGLQMSDQHGGGYTQAANAYATRGSEIYNNTFYGTTSNYGTGTYAMNLRGGAMLFFNNTCNKIITPVSLGNENYNSSDPNDPEYCNDVWIWNNVFNNCTGTLNVISGVGITAGVNYFSDIPTPTNPAPPKPGYTPYPYPHPLAIQVVS